MTGLILDHLWQSTLFAAAAALLALALKRNSARIRYRLWLAASVKFLVPFAALTAAGSALLASLMPPVSMPGLLPLKPIAQPFSAQTLTISALPAQGLDWAQIFVPLLLALWGIGCAAILARWLMRWSRLQRVVRQAVDCSLSASVPVKMAPSRLEPGLVGIWRPVILLPQGIDQRLSPEEMDAILAHEICHWRRRDNLLAAMHMLVEALFWFHPLVWWLGARLNAERERACDESVLAQGQPPQIYAESILKVCQFYLHSPLDCAAGISGADLKRRMETIMENNFSLHLNVAKKLLLAGSSLLVIAVPIAVGVLTSSRGLAQTKMVQGPSAALGTVAPLATASVNPRISGMLVRINFREGAMVKAGDILAEIDPHQYETALQTSEAILARDSAAYANAQLELKRQQSLPGSSAAAQRSPTVAQTVREDAAIVKFDEANVAQARLTLSYTKVIAPFGGRAGLKHADIGNIVYPGSNIVVVTQVKPMSVLFSLPEGNTHLIHLISEKLAQGTKLTVQAYSRDQTKPVATGVLEAIDNQIDTETGTVKLRALFNNDDGSLLPGQLVNIRIPGGIAPN